LTFSTLSQQGSFENTRKTGAVSSAPPKGLANPLLLGGAQPRPLRSYLDIVALMTIRSTALLTIFVSLAAAKGPDLCGDLKRQALPNARITSASEVESGAFTPPGSAKPIASLPSFCRVQVQASPTADSDIHSEVWLPLTNWNGKFLAVGSGGWGGSIGYESMADALRRGYATSATDDGHTGGSGAFAAGHREKFIDFAYRAEHEMTVEAKSMIEAFYGRKPRYSYWNGCSGGGREGLLQAYRYPTEFDGVIAGDPANMRRNAWALWLAVETFKDPAAYIPREKYAMIHRAVLDACDAQDGLKDGLLSNPPDCHPNFKTLQCDGASRGDCLTPRQVQTAQTIISPATTASGKVVFPRLEPGTELAWGRLAGGPEPADLFVDQFRYVVYRNPQWDWRTFDLARDAEKANAVNKDVDELEPNLTAFAKHGGKLLLYHGWSDQQVAPGSSVEFYKSLKPAPDWARLFMVPGMGHCSGGEGPDSFDKMAAIEQWVEQGKAPARLVAAHRTAGKVDRTRPLCAYPQVARYKGSGSVDDEASFACSVP
jgi:feruloyl esterase